MNSLSRTLPPLKAILAFEAVVRLGSVTAAARELGSTQPAVSQQIRALEDALGQPLFSRANRRLTPNAAGRNFYEPASQALWSLAEGAEELRARTEARQIAIGTNFGFAHLWLMPRIADIQAAFPDHEIYFITGDRDGGPEFADCQLTISFERISATPTDTGLLFPETAFPVCSPSFAKANPEIFDLPVAELAALPLLHLDENDARWLDWKGWFAEQGVSATPRRPALMYGNYPLLLNVAAAGEGIALGWSGLVESYLERGDLIACGPSVRRDDHGYRIATRDTTDSAVQDIADWISSHAAAVIPIAAE